MKNPSASQSPLEQPEYPALSDEQREEYYEFSAALVTWQKENEGVRVSFGWTQTGKFLLVIGDANRNVDLHIDRRVAQDALWEILDDAKRSVGHVDRKPPEPTPAEDEWDW